MDLTELGRKLGTAYVADGGIQRGGDKVRVTLRLVRTSDAVAIWAASADIAAAELATGGQRLAVEFAAALAPRVK